MHFLTSPAIYYFTGTHHATYNAASLFYWNFHKENGNLESKHTELASDMTHIWGRPHNHSGLYSSNPKSHLHHYCSPGDTLRTILNLWLVWEKLCQNFRGLFFVEQSILISKNALWFQSGGGWRIDPEGSLVHFKRSRASSFPAWLPGAGDYSVQKSGLRPLHPVSLWKKQSGQGWVGGFFKPEVS